MQLLNMKWAKLIGVGCGISAILLIQFAILSPNGVTYIEPNPYIKIGETILSGIAIVGLTSLLKS